MRCSASWKSLPVQTRVGARAEAALTQAREQLGARLGCEVGEIVWTSGPTEANHAVLHHIAYSTEGKVWLSAIDHPSLLAAARRFFPRTHRFIPVTSADLNWLPDQLKMKRPALVPVMAANNETGVLQPWREALTLCREYSVPFFCDAAQWVGKLPVKGLGKCNYMSGNAHINGGPGRKTWRGAGHDSGAGGARDDVGAGRGTRSRWSCPTCWLAGSAGL